MYIAGIDEAAGRVVVSWVMESVGRYEAVRPGLWATYVDFLVQYGEWVSEGISTEWAATLPVGTDPTDVLNAMLVVMGADDRDLYPGGPSDAWMDACLAEGNAHLATVLSSYGEPDVRNTIRRVGGIGHRDDPDDIVRAFIALGVQPEAAYETARMWRQWIDTVRSSNLPPLPPLSPLSEIEADPRAGWFARLRRAK